MSKTSEERVYDALSRVNDPELNRDLVSLNMVRDVRVDAGNVSLKIVLTTPACPLRDRIEADVREALTALPGVKSVTLEVDAEVRGGPGAGPQPVADVRNIIAVASNKGGVGKTTVSVNLAVALARLGARVGLLDADVTGPNVPPMVGLAAGFMAESEKGLAAVERFSVKVCSLGFVLPRDSAIVWRGPLIDRAIRELLHQLPWGELDYLVIDLPPGTSDASLSVAQSAPLAGVLIVTTPQEVSLEDATKAVTMFQRLGAPLLGVVENMSYFLCPHCGQRTEVFGHGGGRTAAQEMGLEFLGEIPLDVETRVAAEEGVPIAESAPDSPAGQVFRSLAERVAARVSVLRLSGDPQG